jgi:hypothetical protein
MDNKRKEGELLLGVQSYDFDIAKVHTNVDNSALTNEEAICNAKLMAAAPELLEALQNVQVFLNEIITVGGKYGYLGASATYDANNINQAIVKLLDKLDKE